MSKSNKRIKAAAQAVKQANLRRAQAMQGLRASGAAGTHEDRRTKRNRTRATQIAKAVGEYE